MLLKSKDVELNHFMLYTMNMNTDLLNEIEAASENISMLVEDGDITRHNIGEFSAMEAEEIAKRFPGESITEITNKIILGVL